MGGINMCVLSGNLHQYGLEILLKNIEHANLENESDTDFEIRKSEIFAFISSLPKESLPVLFFFQEFILNLEHREFDMVCRINEDQASLEALSYARICCKYDQIKLSVSKDLFNFMVIIREDDPYRRRKKFLSLQYHAQMTGSISNELILIPEIPSIVSARVDTLVGIVADLY